VSALLRRRAAVCAIHPGEQIEELLKLMQKYADVPICGRAPRPDDGDNRRPC
jgi:hypothetical protein